MIAQIKSGISKMTKALSQMCLIILRYAKIYVYNFLIISNHIMVQIVFGVDKRL